MGLKKLGCLGFLRVFIGIVFLLFSCFFFLNSLRQLALGYSSLNYIEATGTITQSELKITGDRFPVYKPIIRYTYSFDGKSYDGERFSYKGPLLTRDQARAEDIMSRFPLGKKVVVYVNPRVPSSSVLEKGIKSNWETGAVIGLILLGIGLWLTYLISFFLRFCRSLGPHSRRKEVPVTPHATPAQPQSFGSVLPPKQHTPPPQEDEGPGLTRKQGWILGLGLGFAGLAMCVVWLMLAGSFMQSSEHWPRVDGVVTQSEVKAYTTYLNGIPVKDDYVAKIEFSYSFGQVTYQSDNIPESKSYSEREDAEKIVTKYPIGKKLQVFVNPKKPNVSTLKPGKQLMYIPLLLTGLLALLISVGVILGILLKRPVQKLLKQERGRS